MPAGVALHCRPASRQPYRSEGPVQEHSILGGEFETKVRRLEPLELGAKTKPLVVFTRLQNRRTVAIARPSVKRAPSGMPSKLVCVTSTSSPITSILPFRAPAVCSLMMT